MKILAPCLSLSLTFLTASVVPAQTSTTLPSGMDRIEGNDLDWATWRFTPARAVYSYKAAVFPWGNASRTLTGVKARRDGLLVTPFVQNSKSIRLYVSYDGNDPERMDIFFDGNHGTGKSLVLGSAAAPATVNYPADPQPPSGSTAPFSVSFPFSQPFVLPANAKNLVFDFRAYATARADGFWYVDAVYTPAGTLDIGSLSTQGTQCPGTPDMPISNFAAWPGSHFVNYVDTAVPGAPVVAWVGNPRSTPFGLGSTCFLYLNPTGIRLGRADNDSRGRAKFVWNRIPNQTSFIGTSISYQFAVGKRGYPVFGALGLTRWGKYTVGAGWPSASNQGSVYTYSLNATHLFDPDRLVEADWVLTRAPVLEVR